MTLGGRSSALSFVRAPNPINAGGTDRPKPALRLADLLHEASIPFLRQINIVMDAHECSSCLACFKPRVQPVRRAVAALDRHHLVRRPRPQAGQGEQVGAKRVLGSRSR
jgi:hypothetical protein